MTNGYHTVQYISRDLAMNKEKIPLKKRQFEKIEVKTIFYLYYKLAKFTQLHHVKILEN